MKKILLLFTSILVLASCLPVSDKDNRLTSNSTTLEDMKDDFLGTQKILALWDSLTAWYWVEQSDNYPSKLEKLLEEEGYNYEVINAWVSGDTSADALARAELYVEQDPDIVLLVIWGNDGLRSKSVEDMKKNIIEIIDMFDDGERKIVLGWMQIPINLWLSYSSSFKKAYKEIAKERKSVYRLESFLEWVGGYARYNLSDRIHPNPDGYDIIVANMYGFLKDEKIIEK